MRRIPVAEIKSIEIINKYDCYTIRWYLTDWCNYRCSYCFQKHSDRKSSVEVLKHNAQRIALFIRINRNKFNFKKIRLSITGGEISLFPLVEILEPIFDEGIDVLSCITNGSGDLRPLIFECSRRNIRLYCDVSFHEEYVSLNYFISKISALKKLDSGHKWKVLSVVTNGNTKIQKRLYEMCKAKNIEISLNCERSNEDGGKTIKLTEKAGIDLIKKSEKEKFFIGCIVEYTNGTIEEYKSRREMDMNLEIDPFGWKCNINHNTIFIYPDLSAKLGFCARKEFSSINDIEIEKGEVICGRHFCPWCFPCKVVNQNFN